MGQAKKDQQLKGPKPPQEVARVPLALDALRVELGNARGLSRAWSETLPHARRRDQIALFARRALESFALEAAPKLRLSPHFVSLFGGLDHVADQLAAAIGREAAALPRVEGLHIITSLYPALMAGRERSALGAFYTPPALTRRLLDLATEQGVVWSVARVLDPAAGGGAFLVQVALRMRDAMAGCNPALLLSQIGTRLTGLEIDPNAASLAQAALEIALAEESTSAGRSLATIVRVCDTLEEQPNANFDVVVGNPPYGRVSLSPAGRKVYARSLFGHANLYGIFTDAALRWTRPNGIIAFLTPTSFLAGKYYASLRALLAEEAPPVAIDFVHGRRGVFEDVLQETLLAIYRKGEGRCRAQIHYLKVANEREAEVIRNGTIGLPDDPAAPWLAPRNPKHGALIAGVELMPTRLGDWGYSVSTGPLVWNRFKSQLRDVPGGKTVHPLIWAEAVSADGHFAFRALKRNHAPYFKLEAGDAWLLVDKACILVQRTTAKEQARRLIAAELPPKFIAQHKGVVVENHLNMIQARDKPKVPPAVLTALINSRVVDELFRCMSGSVAVSAFELQALPLPSPLDVKALARLVAAGAARNKIEAECDRLYRRKA